MITLADLHMHTTASDGIVSPQADWIGTGMKNVLESFLALTKLFDHALRHGDVAHVG